MARISRQRGVALIMVLLVVAIVSIVAVEASSRIQLDIQKSQNRDQYLQAYWYALGGERVARELLRPSLAGTGPIHLGQDWARGVDYPIDGGSVRIRIRDLQACLNINQLNLLDGDPDAPSRLQRQLAWLLTSATKEEDPQARLEALKDWLDRDLQPTGLGGAEDLHYSALPTPYLTANAPLNDLAELTLVEGITPELLDTLSPLLCALPDPHAPININTLTETQAPLIAALFEGQVDTDTAVRLIADRPDEGYDSLDTLWSQLPANDDEPPDPAIQAQLAVRSRYFLAEIRVAYHDARFQLHSRLMDRAGDPVPIQRHYGKHR